MKRFLIIFLCITALLCGAALAGCEKETVDESPPSRTAPFPRRQHCQRRPSHLRPRLLSLRQAVSRSTRSSVRKAQAHSSQSFLRSYASIFPTFRGRASALQAILSAEALIPTASANTKFSSAAPTAPPTTALLRAPATTAGASRRWITELSSTPLLSTHLPRRWNISNLQSKRRTEK